MASPLKEIQPFNTLPEEALEALNNNLILKTYPKDSYVFNQGQASLNFLFIIVTGLAQVILWREKGSPSVVGFRHPGQFFGETVLLSNKRYPASVKAVKDLTCYLLDKQAFEDLLQSYHEFAGFFSHIMADRLRDLYEEMVLEQPSDIYGLRNEPFKKRLSEIMSYPLVTCSPDMPVNEIARIFAQQRISSVVVTGNNGKLLGLVTERDLISKVLALDSNPAVVHAQDIMDKNPTTLHHESFFYQALLTMIKRQGKYILVTEQNRPVGIVTIGDLTKVRSSSAITIVKAIDAANTIEDLNRAVQPLTKVLASLMTEKAAANELCEVISELKDLLTRRLLILAEDELAEAGFGQPPVDYCWLALGSGGRKEQSLASDQDSALIYADSPSGQARDHSSYFNSLAQIVVDGLAHCGVAECSSGIMASNPEWCKPLSAWKTTLHNLFAAPQTVNWHDFNILLDFRPIFGQHHLAEEMRQFALRLCRINPGVFYPMAQFELARRLPLNELQQTLAQDVASFGKAIDLREAGCAHIVNCIRIFALQEGLLETATLDRLDKLVELHVLAPDDAEYYEAAFQSLMLFRIQANMQRLGAGKQPDNKIDLSKLSRRQRSVLQESFLAVDRLRTFTAGCFKPR